MRLLKFIGVFLLTAILVFGFVAGLNWKSFTIFFENREAMMEGNEWVPKTTSLRGMSEYMDENPENASVASVVLSYPDSTIYYEENRRRTMGTLSNFFILLAYAMEIEDGIFSETDRINWSDVTTHQLPDVDESVHTQAFRVAENRDWIREGTISLDKALHLLAEYNSLALSDFLWWKLNPEIWPEIKAEYNLSETDMPLPFSGLYLSISPGIQQLSNREIIDKWQHAPDSEWRDFVIAQSENYVTNSEERESILDFVKENRLANTFMEERDALTLFPKTTAVEITGLLEKIIRNESLNSSISNRLKKYMRWPMDSQQGIERDFSDYGAMYDNRMGLLNGIDFGISAYTGDTTVQALFLDRLPIGFWFHASGGHMHQDFMQRLIFDPALIEQMNRVVQR